MNLYAEYIEEREDAKLYHDEDGFFTYKLLNDAFFVKDLYVRKEKRREGIGNKYAKKIEELAKKHDCLVIFCTVCVEANNWEVSKEYIESNDYSYVNKVDTMIYFKKEI